MRTMLLKDFVLEEFNQMLAEEGRDIRITIERARPTLAVDSGRIVGLWEAKNEHVEPER